MASGKRYTDEEKDEIMQYRQTHTYQETADKFNVSQMTLARWSRDYKNKIIGDRISGDASFRIPMQVLKYLEGVKAVALLSDSGETVSLITESTFYEDILFVGTIALLAAASRNSETFALGDLKMVFTKSTDGILFMRDAGPNLLLVMIYDGAADVQRIVTQDFPIIDRVRQDVTKRYEARPRAGS